MNINHVLLKDFTSLKIGGDADIVVINSKEELTEVIEYVNLKSMRIHVLGEGTNTYFGEDLKNLLILKMEIKGVKLTSQTDNYKLQANSGEIWDDVVKFSIENELWGLENLSYIPGTVGGAPVQNIGAYGSELKDVLDSVLVYDTDSKQFKELTNEQCAFAYRDSVFKQNPKRYIIISITLTLSKNKKPILTYKPLDSLNDKENITLQEIRNLVIKTRKEKLPDYTMYPNSGSFFKNSIITKNEGQKLKEKYTDIVLFETGEGYKVPTAWLIEHVAKMKGVRIGDVGTWPVQPLVLVNYGNAASGELNSFASLIIEKIKKETGITLEREVNFVE